MSSPHSFYECEDQYEVPGTARFSFCLLFCGRRIVQETSEPAWICYLSFIILSDDLEPISSWPHDNIMRHFGALKSLLFEFPVSSSIRMPLVRLYLLLVKVLRH